MSLKTKIISIFDWRQRLKDLKSGFSFIWSNLIFLLVLFIYVIRGIFKKLTTIKFIGRLFVLIKINFLIDRLTDLMYIVDKNEDGGVTRSFLIQLAFRNMKSKKNRAIVTIGGVAVGVGAIVFLVSVGYGLEKLVINRVAKLDELKMADVTLGKAASIKLDDDSLNKIKGIKDVSEVVPMVSMVSKVKFNNSVLDVMSFGVNQKYIEAVNPNFIEGEKFKDKDTDFAYVSTSENNVLGESQEVIWVEDGQRPEDNIFTFNIKEGEKVSVLNSCSDSGEVLGYVTRSEGGYIGEYSWGDAYISTKTDKIFMSKKTSKEVSKWLRSKIPLWSVDSSGLLIPKLDKNGQQEWEIGCFRPDETIIETKYGDEYKNLSLDTYLMGGKVLGEATSSAELISNTATGSASLDEEAVASTSAELFGGEVATDSSGVEWVQFKQSTDDPNKLKEIPFLGSITGEAYVSTGMLKLLGIKTSEAIGKTFMVSYIVPDGNIKGMSGRLQSTEVEYKIKGVIDDEASNYYYYQLADAKRLGISVYSQLKVLTTDKSGLSEVRKSIEVLGFKTDSTADTVTQIENLFKTLRFILGALGTIALAVASLGMFNTMTVSLLERTREVGVMKTMGMLSNEVRELFLAESMIMGVGGGALGIIFGFVLGKLLSIILSSISVFKGQGIVDIAYIPWFFTLFILIVSFLVGMVTGWYPSKRARQVSALNALRYE